MLVASASPAAQIRRLLPCADTWQPQYLLPPAAWPGWNIRAKLPGKSGWSPWRFLWLSLRMENFTLYGVEYAAQR